MHPLFASSTAALAYAQDPGTGEVNPLAPTYLDVSAECPNSVMASSPTAPWPDEDDDGLWRRRPFLLAGSGLAGRASDRPCGAADFARGRRRAVDGSRHQPCRQSPSPTKHVTPPSAHTPAVAAPAPAPPASTPAPPPSAAPPPPPPQTITAPTPVVHQLPQNVVTARAGPPGAEPASTRLRAAARRRTSAAAGGPCTAATGRAAAPCPGPTAAADGDVLAPAVRHRPHSDQPPAAASTAARAIAPRCIVAEDADCAHTGVVSA